MYVDLPVTSAAVAVPLAGNVTCTITNTDVAGTWAISKASNPPTGSTVQPGDVITYTVTAQKLAGQDPRDVVVNDDLSAVLNNATFVVGSITASTGTATLTGMTLAWTIPQLSGSQTVTYQVKVNAGASGVTLRNVITSPGSNPCVAPADQAARALAAVPAAADAPDCTTTTHDTPAWRMVKSSDPTTGSTVPVGSTITYTLTVTNTYAPPVTGAVVTDDLSAVLNHGTLVAVPAGATLTGTTLTWAVPTLAALGDTATLTYQVRLSADAYSVTVTNVATPGAGGTCTVCSTTHLTPAQTVVPPIPPVPPNPALPNTGSNPAPILWWAAVLLLVGAAAVLWSERRRVAAQHSDS